MFKDVYMDPVVEPIVDPVVEPIVDPVVEPIVDPVVDTPIENEEPVDVPMEIEEVASAPAEQPEILLADVPITDDNVALNVMVAFLDAAQKRGAFSMNESSKIWECIQRFIQK